MRPDRVGSAPLKKKRLMAWLPVPEEIERRILELLDVRSAVVAAATTSRSPALPVAAEMMSAAARWPADILSLAARLAPSRKRSVVVTVDRPVRLSGGDSAHVLVDMVEQLSPIHLAPEAVYGAVWRVRGGRAHMDPRCPAVRGRETYAETIQANADNFCRRCSEIQGHWQSVVCVFGDPHVLRIDVNYQRRQAAEAGVAAVASSLDRRCGAPEQARLVDAVARLTDASLFGGLP